MNKKIIKLIVFIICIPVLLLLLFQFLIATYFQNRIIERLQKEIIIATDSAYSAKIGHFNIDILSASLRLEGVEFLNVKEKRDYVKPLYNFKADRIHFENFVWMDLIRKNDFKIRTLVFENPQMMIWQGANFRDSVSDEKDTASFSFYDIIKPVFHSLVISKIEVQNAGITIYKAFSDTAVIFSSRENAVDILNFRIDPSAAWSKHYFLADSFKVHIQNFNYILADGLYTLTAEQCQTSYTDSSMKIEHAQLIPNFNRRNFDDEVGHQTDRMKINAALVKLTGMNTPLFFEKGILISRHLLIDSLDLYAYRDKNKARKSKEVASLQAVLKSIPLYIAVETVEATHGRITYEEVAPGHSKAGKIYFNSINASITGLINDTTVITTENKLVLKGTAGFMKSGQIEVNYMFPMLTNKMEFECSGQLTHLNMTDLNLMLEPNANIKIKNGFVDKMEFSLRADDLQSRGKMTFLYHDLTVELKDKHTHQTKWKEDVLGFLVNRIILKKDNPMNNKEVRVTDIKYQRNRERFIFNYTWKSLLSGIKPAIGIPSK